MSSDGISEEQLAKTEDSTADGPTLVGEPATGPAPAGRRNEADSVLPEDDAITPAPKPSVAPTAAAPVAKTSPGRQDGTQKRKRPRKPRPEGAHGQAPQKAAPAASSQNAKRRKRPQGASQGTGPLPASKSGPRASTGNTGPQPAAQATRAERPDIAGWLSKNKPSGINLPKIKLPKIKPPSIDDLMHPTLVTKIIYGVLLVWIIGVVFFWGRFLPGTVVNGVDTSWKTIHAATESFGEVADDYKLKVQDQGVTLSLAGKDIDLSFDAKAFERASTHRLTKLFWPIALFLPRSYTVTKATTFDEARLQSICQQTVEAVNAGARSSVNAAIAYDEASGAYVGVAESQGTRLDDEAVLGEVSKAVSTLQETLSLTKGVLEKPTVVEDDPRFAAAIEKAEAFPDLSIDLRLSNVVVATVDETLYRTWLAIGDDYDVHASVEAIEEWTKGDLSAQLDSVGKLRTWNRWDEKLCQVYDGTYGWNIDGSALATEIASHLDEHVDTPIEVPCTQRAALYNPGGPDWGNRYIEVDMTEQCAYMYDEGGNIIWQSECVTGNESKNDGTVIGVYAIEKKKSPEKLVGLDNDGDGEPDYENDVDFWMPFYGGYGLHDAIWRDTFDYDTYLTDGSHGCVNLPYYAAATLYELCEVGDPVVVHW